MDKIKFDFFDILGYLIPGTALLLSLWVTADHNIRELADLYTFISKITANTLLAGVVVAYVMGFTLHFLGSLIFSGVYRKRKKKRDSVTSDLSMYWALIREHGGKHLPILDRWQALKALSSNLAAFSAIAVILAAIKWSCTQKPEWLIFCFVFGGLFFAYLNRAKVFSAYLDDDSYAVFQTLNLKEKLPENL
jgi:hypothetical protein